MLREHPIIVNIEREIIVNATENFKNLMGFKVKYREGNDKLDGIISLNRGKLNDEFIIEVKKEVRNHQIAQLENYKNKYPNFLLIAGRIYSKTLTASSITLFSNSFK